MEHMKILSNLYEDVLEKYQTAKSPEGREEVVKATTHFLIVWKKMEGKIIENCLKMSSCCEGLL